MAIHLNAPVPNVDLVELRREVFQGMQKKQNLHYLMFYKILGTFKVSEIIVSRMLKKCLKNSGPNEI